MSKGVEIAGKRIRYQNQIRDVVSAKNGKLYLSDCVLVTDVCKNTYKRDWIYGCDDYEIIGD